MMSLPVMKVSEFDKEAECVQQKKDDISVLHGL